MKKILTFCFWSLTSFCLLGQTSNRALIEQEIDSLINVSLNLNIKRRLDSALTLEYEAKNKVEHAFGKLDTDYAKCIFYQAVTYEYNTEYFEADRVFQGFLDTLKMALDTESVDYAQKLIFWTYMGTGYSRRFWSDKRTESSYLTARRIIEKSVGTDDLLYAKVIHYGGIFYNLAGDYEKAEPLYLKAMEIRERTLGTESPRYAESLTGLAILYNNSGRKSEAEKYYRKAREAWGKIWGKKSAAYLSVTSGLAAFYMKYNRYAEADSLASEMKRILIETNQKKTNAYKNVLFLEATLFQTKKQYAEAEACFLELRDYFESLYGKNHGYTISQYANIGYMYAIAGICDKAQANILKFYDLSFNSTIRSTRYLSSADLILRVDKEYRGLLGLGITHNLPQCACRIPGIRYDIALLFKGIAVDAGSKLRNLAFSDSTSAHKYQLLQSYYSILSKEYAKPVTSSQNVQEYEEKANLLEKELARTVPGYSNAIHLVKWQEVRAKLKPGEAGVEFMYYPIDDDIVYSALVLRPEDTIPIFVPLFKEKQLAGLLPATNDPELIDSFYTMKTGQIVNNLIWQPLDSLLRNSSTIYCSPSGLLHRINLGVVPVDSSHIFLDRHNLLMLGSTRQLVIGTDKKYIDKSAALFGGIQYDVNTAPHDATSPPAESDKDVIRSAFFGTLSFPYDTTVQGRGVVLPWGPLPYTEIEVTDITRILKKEGFKTSLNTGVKATEEVFKQTGQNEPSPRIIHIATHGYFFPDPKEGGNNGPVFKHSIHPMIRSGIILAGANQAWTTGNPPVQKEDGILTAYEISQMDLSNTELVVLSACDTGLGDIAGNEGVLGLQRAFKIAGVKYLIISLWQVSDKKTGELMKEFYRQYLTEKKTVPEAFRNAQAEMRKKYPENPYYWAGFVLVE